MESKEDEKNTTKSGSASGLIDIASIVSKTLNTPLPSQSSQIVDIQPPRPIIIDPQKERNAREARKRKRKNRIKDKAQKASRKRMRRA